MFWIATLVGAGATLCLIQTMSARTDLAQILEDLSITTLSLPPSALDFLVGRHFPALQTIIAGGEACAAERAAEWARQYRLINAYGPSEVTVCASLGQWDGDGRVVPIGRPISNTRLYVLDEWLEPVPIGVSGELYIRWGRD